MTASRNFISKLTAVLLGSFFALLLAEIACQVLFVFMVAPILEAQRTSVLHYYVADDNPSLTYSLKPGYQIEEDGRRIAINQHGLRADIDGINAWEKVALLGDSVAFGIGLSQEQTLRSALQRLTGDSVEVLNFATPGYGLEQLHEHLKEKYPIYRPQHIYYVLNINDFTRRNTIYEGADNGLFRIYEQPFLKLPFFVRKATYRVMKEGKLTSVNWYRWMFDGNKDLLEVIGAMAEYARKNGSEFRVVISPPAVAYENGTFALLDIIDEISKYCSDRAIPVISPIKEISESVFDLQDGTDHLTAKGSDVMARVIWDDLNK